MPIASEISGPLSDRALTHGRNVMAVASVILVLSYVPDIDIKRFQVFGFTVEEGGELSVWGLLSGVLVYYAVRFGVDCWVDFRGWKEEYGEYLIVSPHKEDHAEYRHARRVYKRFWFFDFAPPIVMACVAIIAAIARMQPLLP